MPKRTAPHNQVLPAPKQGESKKHKTRLIYELHHLTRSERSLVRDTIQQNGCVADCRLRSRGTMLVTTKVDSRRAGSRAKLDRLLVRLNQNTTARVEKHRRIQDQQIERQEKPYRRVHPAKKAALAR